MHNSTMQMAVATVAAFSFNDAARAAEPAEKAGMETVSIEPLLEARLRHESVDQDAWEAAGLTLRLRVGAMATIGSLSVIAETESTLAAVEDYNAFPFPLAGESQSRPQYPLIADPENVELNRLQLQYRTGKGALTAGRQRINLDDQRWVGSVGWRQNEQTFDALRGEGKLGPMNIDLSYSISQRTIFGQAAGPRSGYDGEFILAGVSTKVGTVQGKLFAYLLDYDEPYFVANNSQTYGGFIVGSLPLARSARLDLRASYARQSDYRGNPFKYSADYWAFEGSSGFAGFTGTIGWEQLGSNSGRAVQTPMATLHKFNGWADLFVTTPPAGLQDAYLSIGKKFSGVRMLPGLNANVTFHQFGSAVGNIEYGREWDASAGLRIGQIGLLVKYADYDAKAFGQDTRKLWLQAEWALQPNSR